MIKYLEKESDFKELTKKRVLVDFYADWCSPCRALGEILEKLSSDRSSLDIIKVNTDKFQDMALKMGIMSIPALFIIENGEIQKKQVGFISENELREFIK